MDARFVPCAGLLLTLLAACSTDEASTSSVPPASPAGPSAPAAVAPKTALNLAARPGWETQAPSSAMRKAQFLLPRAAGDGEDASLVVYYFGGQGGSREDNLERWATQFELPGGGSTSEAMQHSTRRVGGLEIVEASLSGTYVAETSPGSGERLRKPGWRMLAAIVENHDGPWYVKLVGPEATVAHWEASFREFVDSMAPPS